MIGPYWQQGGFSNAWAIDFGIIPELSAAPFAFVAERDTFLLRWKGGPDLLVPGVMGSGAGGDAGLLGFVLDPLFSANRFVYTVQTVMYHGGPSTGGNYVMRWTLDLTKQALRDPVIVLRYDSGRSDNGGTLKIGPDNCFYLSTGDLQDNSRSQNLNSLNGKILRFNRDGSVPSDNPYPGSYVYASGFRNPLGMCWSGSMMFATDKSLAANDKVVRVLPAGDYGYPVASAITQPAALTSGDNMAWQPHGMCATAGVVYVACGGAIPGILFGNGGVVSSNVIGSRLSFPTQNFDVGPVNDCVIGKDNNLYFVTGDALYMALLP